MNIIAIIGGLATAIGLIIIYSVIASNPTINP